MDSKYSAQNSEKKIYELWEKSGFFNPDNLTAADSETFTVMIPPPNITGTLHMGHALDNTIQDIMVRFARLNGKKTLWMPGTDHAGIATQNVVEKGLKKNDLTRHKLGREKFVETVWEWKKKYGDIILGQLKQLGCSCDWSRLRFTLDEQYTKAVTTAFIHYYEKGYIYRGPRIVNWCPRCATAISDIEIKYKEEIAKLWHIKYKFVDPKDGDALIVATTRPETMLGDTAVAVNPNDERYKNLIGEKVIVPIVNREVPIVGHYLVDATFGTGALKITPAHDAADWKIGKENNLPIINVIGPNARMTAETGIYAELKTTEAREKIVETLRKDNQLVKEEDYPHRISLCDRCSASIEPQISKQWFVKMDSLAAKTISALENNQINIQPEKYKNILIDWFKNIQDWCISRQLWWGHQLPVWFCENSEEQFVVSLDKPAECPFCKKCRMKRSEDVLDTWFSSALWPFATLGWPEKTEDSKKFYPTQYLTTARDIIYLWVARMIFSGLEFMEQIPFQRIYIHPTVFNTEGKRMSKSLGTGLDPVVMIEKFGADALRFGLIMSSSKESQVIKFDERPILAARNFINKLWNIHRFVEMQKELLTGENDKPEAPSLADQWIMSSFNSLINFVTEKIQQDEFGEASKKLYEFIWHEFADWYLEISKYQIKTRPAQTIKVLEEISEKILIILHPFTPFVTEKIWQTKGKKSLLMIEAWPKSDSRLVNQELEERFTQIKNLITKIRQDKEFVWKQNDWKEEEQKIIFNLTKTIQSL